MSENKNINPYYTLGRWKVKKGMEKEFIDTWTQLGDLFFNLPSPSPWGTLIQSVEDSSLFYSFGPWPDMEAIYYMRNDKNCREGIGKIINLCEEASPGSYKLIRTVEKPS